MGELLPVYLNRPGRAQASGDGDYRLVLTREGWLQPWVRTRKTEDEEQQRLDGMASFHTLSPVGAIKPGASVLSMVRDAAGNLAPALVAQPFGKGRVGALMIGDLWRWGLKRKDPAESDLDRSWRQTVRWLVGDVPGRVEVSVRPKADAAGPAVEVVARVRDAEYRPLDNAKVALKIALPGGGDLTLDAPPDGREAGTYAATYVPRQPGAYRLTATATAPDGSRGRRPGGRVGRPARRRRVRPARARPRVPQVDRREDRRRGRRRRPARRLRRQPRLARRPDQGALDLAALAPPALLPGRHRLPRRRVGHPPGQRPGVTGESTPSPGGPPAPDATIEASVGRPGSPPIPTPVEESRAMEHDHRARTDRRGSSRPVRWPRPRP